MTTQAIEFTTMTHDGVIDLPKKMSHLSGIQVRVILLLDNAPKVEYCTHNKFPDLTEFRNQLPPAKTSAVELIRNPQKRFARQT